MLKAIKEILQITGINLEEDKSKSRERRVNKTITLKTLKSQPSDKTNNGLFTAGRNARNRPKIKGL